MSDIPIERKRKTGCTANGVGLNEKAIVKITDLCIEDRERIANLLRTLTKTAEEKEIVSKQLENERALFEQQKSGMIAQLKQLLKEKKAIKRSMDDCQKLISELHQVLYVQKNQSTHDHTRESSDKKFSTTSVQTEDTQARDDSWRTKLFCSTFQQHPVRDCYQPDYDPISNLSSKKFNKFSSDQRHTMEAALRHQEQLLREKQALLQIKQNEFQKRFDYFVRHGTFPDATGANKSDHFKQIDEKQNNTPSADFEDNVPPAVSKALAKKSPVRSANTDKQPSSQSISKCRSPVLAPASQSLAKQDASVGVNLDRSVGNDIEKRDEFAYAHEKELNDIANISALLDAINNDTSEDSSMSVSCQPATNKIAKRIPETLNEAVSNSGADQINDDETTLLAEIFFLT